MIDIPPPLPARTSKGTARTNCSEPERLTPQVTAALSRRRVARAEQVLGALQIPGGVRSCSFRSPVPWWPSPVTSRLGSPGVAGHGDAAAVEAPAKARHGGFQTVESVQHALEVLDTEAPDPRRAGVLGREAKCPGVGVGCRWTARPQLPGRLSGAPSRSDQRQANLRSLIACQVVLLRGGVAGAGRGSLPVVRGSRRRSLRLPPSRWPVRPHAERHSGAMGDVLKDVASLHGTQAGLPLDGSPLECVTHHHGRAALLSVEQSERSASMLG
jgi:hypothetical protein